MSAIFFEKEAAKITEIFHIFKGPFVMGGPIDMNVDVFWETSVGFQICVVLQLFLEYSQK